MQENADVLGLLREYKSQKSPTLPTNSLGLGVELDVKVEFVLNTRLDIKTVVELDAKEELNIALDIKLDVRLRLDAKPDIKLDTIVEVKVDVKVGAELRTKLVDSVLTIEVYIKLITNFVL